MGIIEKLVIDDITLAVLEERASQHGRTVEQEAVEALQKQFRPDPVAEFIRRADAIAAMTPKGVVQTDSTLLIREDRDR